MSFDASFEKIFQEFLGKIRPYNAKQRKEIAFLFSNSLNGIIASFPAPRFEEDILNGNGVELEGEGSAADELKLRKLVTDFELLLNDRMYSLGQDKALFQRFDSKLTGYVNESKFRAVCGLLGILITDQELKGFVSKYDVKRDGTIHYEDLLKVLLALREIPRSAQQDAYSSAFTGRPKPTQSQVDELIIKAKATDPLQLRFERGLNTLRETMYLKSSNYHSLFQSLQDPETKKVTTEVTIAQLLKYGFPSGECTNEELATLASEFSIETPGLFNYNEFLSFFLGHIPVESAAVVPVTFAEQPNLQQALVKINNLNLRKVFKDLDDDNDGCITTEALTNALVENGLSESFKKDPNFKEYAETFSLKKKGLFSYAEFLKFINQRLQQAGLKSMGQLPATSSLPPTTINDGLNASEIMDLVVSRCRTSNISVESVLKHFDSNNDGFIQVPEFFQALAEFGFNLNHQSADTLFNAFDQTPNGVDISEFAKTVANPFRNSKLSVRVRHAPGGESSIPFGTSYDKPDVIETPRKASIRMYSKDPTFDVSNPQNNEPNASDDKRMVKQLQPTGGSTKIDLSHIPEEAPERVPRPETRGGLDGSAPPNTTEKTKETPLPDAVAFEKPKSRPPPGGQSSISFTNDHGFTPSKPSVSVFASKDTVNLIGFDPAAPSETVSNPRPHTAGGRSTISLTDQVDENAAPTPSRTAFAVLQSPGGNSSISFSSEPEKHKPIQKILSSPGGNSTFTLAHDHTNNQTPNASRPQDKLNIDLSFDPNRADDNTSRRLWGTVKDAKGAETNVQISHPHRNEADLDSPAPRTARKSVIEGGTGAAALAHLGSDDGANTLSAYKSEQVQIDMAVLTKISDAIYAHSQRLRHTFQEFTKGLHPTLSVSAFKEGIKNLNVQVDDAQIDALYNRFDGDLDGSITYSEFVRMLSTKE